MTDSRGSRLRYRAPGSFVLSAKAAIAAAVRRAISELRSSPALRWETAAFAGALVVYGITRFWRLADYPIYFFCDEAIEPLAAEELLRHGFRNANGWLFPLYFQNGGAWVPLLSVWAHVVSVELFGKSVEVARGTAAAFTLLGSAAVGLTLKYAFRSRLWWAGPLFLATTPALFLHSRTTFETTFMVSFFACFILFYLLYRCRSPWFLYPAILLGACTFYSYSVGQVVVSVAAALLGVVDIRYHLRHWRHVLAGLALLVIVLLPLYRFRKAEPQAAAGQLTRVASYWLEQIPLRKKIDRLGKEYALGFSPKYWFFPNDKDLTRHKMAGYGHIRKQFLPLIAIGLAVCIWRVRSAPHRSVLICALAAPSGAALASIGITRSLSFVVPASILATLGTGVLLERIRPARARWVLKAGVFILLAASSFHLLHDALTNGPLWYHDYLWGQQWGAKQLFEIIPQYLKADPNNRVALTSDWANGADLFPRFFLKADSPEAARVVMASVDDLAPKQLASLPQTVLATQIASLPRTTFIMTPKELEIARTAETISSVQVDRVLNCPDGQPCFYFVRLAPSSSSRIAGIIAKEREALHILTEGKVVFHGETLAIRHSRMDRGRLEDIFDEDPKTMGLFNATNPAVMEIRFPQPRPIRKVILTVGSGAWEVNLRLSVAEGTQGQSYSAIEQSGVPDPQIQIPIDKGPAETEFLRMEIRAMWAGDFAIIHVRDLQFR